MKNDHGKVQKERLPHGLKKLQEFDNYAAYLAMGITERIAVFGVKKGTDEDFTAKFRVSAKTLWEWKGRDDFWDRRNHHLKRLRQYTGPVLHALARKAIQRGDAYEVETFMRIVENYVPKQKQDMNVEGIADLIAQDMLKSNEEDGSS